MTENTLRSSLAGSTLAAFLGLALAAGADEGAQSFVVTDAHFYDRNPAKEELGRLLFFDKILSGNQDIACATCHHPLTGTSDGLSLPLGNGGVGLGPMRRPDGSARGVNERIPRNAPALFNLGAREFKVLFHDGRLETDPTQPGGFHSRDRLPIPRRLDNVLAAQALQPVVSVLEMAGNQGEGPIADAVFADRLSGRNGAWDLLAQRLRGIDGYVDLFKAAFPEIEQASGITFVHAANAIAAFEAAAFRCTNSPFDRYARGEQAAATPKAIAGAALFNGKAGCGSCHSGPFQTDHAFHAIGVPQIGPGRGDNQPGFFDGLDDFGRGQATGIGADQFKFRTPSLRQVAVTGPWGHDGAYNDLELMVRHHLNPVQALAEYDPTQAVLPSRPDLDLFDLEVQTDPQRRQGIAQAVELQPVTLTDEEISDLIEFLNALTDPRCLDLRRTIPAQVPSGLPVFD